jgi:glycosyltransferase involved in cell wall biosynthesis
MLVGKNILIISTEPWGTNFVSKHHYAINLSERGNSVFFLNPPGKTDTVSKISENLSVIDYSLGLFRGVNKMPGFLRDFFNRILVNKILRLAGKKIDIVWSFDPFRFQNLRLFKSGTSIYHPVDIHFYELEIEAVKSADIVFATSQKIIERFSEIKKPKFVINHGLAKHFLEKAENIDFKVDNSSISVGYIGNINSFSLDKVTLLKILKENNEIQFYFIGPYEKSNLSDDTNKIFIDEIRLLSNVHLLGPKNSISLPSYLFQFDLFLMCYTGDINVEQMANPHKTLEYLSSGKLLVSNYTDEYKDKPDLFLMCKSNKDLPELFKYALNNLNSYNSEELQEKRKKFAAENTYEYQIVRIENHLSNLKN